MAYCGQIQPKAYKQHLVEELEREGAEPGAAGSAASQNSRHSACEQLDIQLIYS